MDVPIHGVGDDVSEINGMHDKSLSLGAELDMPVSEDAAFLMKK